MHGRIDEVSTEPTPLLEVHRRSGTATSVRAEYARLYRRVALTDALSSASAMLVASWVWSGFEVPKSDLLVLIAATPLVTVGVFALFHLYDAYRFGPAEEFRRIILAVSLAVTGMVTLAFWSQSTVSRLWLALSWALALVLALATRRAWHWYIGRARVRGRLAFPTLIVGTNGEAQRLAEVMSRPGFGFRPIGMVSMSSRARSDGLPVLGMITDLRDLIRETGAECVFVAGSAVTPDEMGAVAKALRLEGVEVRVTATLPDVLASRLSVQPLGGVTALSLRPVRLTGAQAAAKRVFDLVLAGLTTVLLSPLMLVLALLVKATSPGPILYRQRRVGHRGRPFTMLKFRTMRANAHAMVEDLRREHDVGDLMFKLPDDPRVTRVGRFLRRWSLDELPQLLNVLRGQMSIVGPRPPLPEEVTRYEDWQFDRLEVPPGLTGLWQVSGRADLTFDDCVRLDLFYIENWSLTYDLYIVAKTIPVLLSKRGAY